MEIRYVANLILKTINIWDLGIGFERISPRTKEMCLCSVGRQIIRRVNVPYNLGCLEQDLRNRTILSFWNVRWSEMLIKPYKQPINNIR